MENNIIENVEEITEVVEEITNVDSGKTLKVVVGVGLGAVVSAVAYKYAIKPTVGRFKDWKEKRKIEKKYMNVTELFEDDNEDDQEV